MFEKKAKDGITDKEFSDWLLHLSYCNKDTGNAFASLRKMAVRLNGWPKVDEEGKSLAEIKDAQEKKIKGWAKTLANRRASLVKKGWLIRVDDFQRGERGMFTEGAKRQTSTYQIPRKLWKISRFYTIDSPSYGNMQTDEYSDLDHNPENEDYGYPENKDYGDSSQSIHNPENKDYGEPSTVIPKSGTVIPKSGTHNPKEPFICSAGGSTSQFMDWVKEQKALNLFQIKTYDKSMQQRCLSKYEEAYRKGDTRRLINAAIFSIPDYQQKALSVRFGIKHDDFLEEAERFGLHFINKEIEKGNLPQTTWLKATQWEHDDFVNLFTNGWLRYSNKQKA